MLILSEIPEAEARAALDKIGDSALDPRNAGTEVTVTLANGAGMIVRYVLCSQNHPEVRSPRCRMEVVGRIIRSRRGWHGRLGGK